jgi:hypothetical protein
MPRVGLRAGARLAALALALAPLRAAADPGDPPAVTYPTLPAHAAAAEGFVPAGWALETRLSGDLDGDHVDDLVLVLHDHDKANVIDNTGGLGDPVFDTNPRILAIAFGKPGGGFDLVVQNHTLIPRHDNPAADDYLDGVSIERGTLRVKLHLFVSAGSWSTSNVAYAFRFQSGRFELIGYDGETVQRNTGETETVSVNYLTGKLKLTTGTIDNDKPTKVVWQALPPRPRPRLDAIANGIEFDPRATAP